MHIHPDLRALRGDDSPQRNAQQAMHRATAHWRAGAGAAPLLEEFERFAADAPLALCPQLAALFAPGSAEAMRLAAGFIAAGVQTLAQWPLAHLPQRHFHDGTLSSLALARSGFSTLSLVAIDGAGFNAAPPARHASFWPGEAWESVISGSGEADLLDLPAAPSGSAASGPAPLSCRAISLVPGSALARDAGQSALVLRRVQGTMVSLRLQRRRKHGEASREVEIFSGALVHQSAGNPNESRVELMLAVLGRMGRGDSAPVMAAIAREPNSPALRWQALRECLALDSGTGFAALSDLATDAADPLAAPAGALRAQLIETYPQLAGAC